MTTKNNQLAPSEFVLSLLKNAVNQAENNSSIASCFDLMKDGLACIEDVPNA
jgi:hypothetical protein